MNRILPLLVLSLVACANPQKKATSAPPASAAAATPAAKQAKAALVTHDAGATSQKHCVSDTDDRTIQIAKTDDGGCAVSYVKLGQKKEIASAKHELKHCEDVFERVVKRLEDSGFDCE